MEYENAPALPSFIHMDTASSSPGAFLVLLNLWLTITRNIFLGLTLGDWTLLGHGEVLMRLGAHSAVQQSTRIVSWTCSFLLVVQTRVRKLQDMHASPVSSEVDYTLMGLEYQTSFKLATQLTFSMLSYALKNPTQKASPFARATLNPYLTIALTFLSTKHPATLHILERSILERSIRWAELVGFFATIPRNIMLAQGLDMDREVCSRNRTSR